MRVAMARDLRRVQFISRRQQPVAVTDARLVAPFASVVELADHPRTHVVAPVVEFFLQLVFEDLALLFDHQDFFQSLRKGAHAFRLQRPCHADLVEPDTDVGRDLLVDAEVCQRLPGIQIRLAGSDDADPGARTVPDDAIELVGTRVGQRRIPLEVIHAGFLIQHRIRPADVQAAFRQVEIGRQHDLDAVRIEVDRGA